MGGVLIDLNKQACINAFKKLGFEDVENFIGEYVQADFFLQLERGTISPEKFYTIIREKVKKNIDDEEIKEAWFAFLLDIPQKKLDLLLELKKSYKVFMLSNTNAIHFPEIKRKYFEKDGHNLSDYFDKCYLSYEIHQNKPAKEIFDFMIRDSAILPQESLFIDDGRTNIEMAKGLKFQTYLAKEQEDFSHLFVSLL